MVLPVPLIDLVSAEIQKSSLERLALAGIILQGTIAPD